MRLACLLPERGVSASARGQQPAWERRSAAKGSVAEQFCGSLPPCLRAWRRMPVTPSFPHTGVPPKARFCPGYSSAPRAGWHFSAAWKERRSSSCNYRKVWGRLFLFQWQNLGQSWHISENPRIRNSARLCKGLK